MVGRCYSRSLRLDGDSVKLALDSVIAKPVKLSSMKLGRNDPCRCGSGKKYKQCCLGRDGASVVDLAEGIGGEVVVVQGFDHRCCWSRVWAKIAEFPAEIAVESQRH
jgi:hypothetical protein